MCYSKETSMMSFIFGLTTSFLLIKYGNMASDSTNKTIGYFFMFVSFMQLVEYFIWSDLDCVSGSNKFASIVGPLLNHLQPIVLFLLANIYLQSTHIIASNIIITTNIFYLFYVGYKYYNYVKQQSNLCIKENYKEHLDWTWKKDFNYNIYHFILFINIINYSNNINLIMTIIVSYIILYFSSYNFKDNIGEFWCLIVTGIPLFNLFMQRILDINN